jgi:hypothetical protein
MTVARNVADVRAEHVTFEIECIDRMFLNVYVPQLQYPNGLVGYVHRQLGLPIASTAPLARITDRFAAACTGSPTERVFRGWISPRVSARTTSCSSG